MHRAFVFGLVMLIGGADCADAAKPTSASHQPVSERWETLFDGKSLDAWRGYRQEGLPPNWSIDKGALKTEGKGANLVTREQYGDFDLHFEWKVSRHGNSGVLYRVSEDTPYASNTGPEYQVIDNAYFKSPSPLQSAAALYALYPTKVEPKPVGEWNTGRIRIEKGRVQHWLNSELVVDAKLDSPDWDARLNASKFANSKDFNKNQKGRISLQEHGTPVWFRAIRVMQLD